MMPPKGELLGGDRPINTKCLLVSVRMDEDDGGTEVPDLAPRLAGVGLDLPLSQRKPCWIVADDGAADDDTTEFVEFLG
jgi:hypothetical protein